MHRAHKILCILAALLLLSAASLHGQPPDSLWMRTYGGDEPDECQSVKQTADGGFIMAGSTNSSESVESALWLVRTDAAGEPVWSRIYECRQYTGSKCVQQTADGGFIASGHTEDPGPGMQADVYLLRTDENGDTLWTKEFGAYGDDLGYWIEETSDGGFVVAGYGCRQDTYKGDVYLRRLDADGNLLWTRNYGGSDSDIGCSVAETPDGGYVVVGYTFPFGGYGSAVYLIRTDADGDPIWSQHYTYTQRQHNRAFCVQVTSAGDYIIAGYTQGNVTGVDACLMRVDDNGDVLWTRVYETNGIESGWHVRWDVRETPDGGFAVAGTAPPPGGGQSDFYLLRTDANGDSLWSATYGGSLRDICFAFDLTPIGGYVIGGRTYSFGASDGDAFLVRTEFTVPAVVDMDPDVLNPRSGGRRVTSYIELPEVYDPADIDVSTVTLNEIVQAEIDLTCVGDHDEDGIPDRMVKFSRSDVIDILPNGEHVEVRVSGEVRELPFVGADTIRVLMPRLAYPNGGEVIEIGQECTIAWEVPEGYNPDWYDVYYSLDGGDRWNVIAEETEGRCCPWLIPNTSSVTCLVLVEAYDGEGIMGYDTSDEVFTIGDAAGAPTGPALPTRFALYPITPNPATRGATIRFDLPGTRHVNLTIHDVHGKLVRELIDDLRSVSSHWVGWDGRNDSGGEVPAGIYFVHLQAGQHGATDKIVVIR